ncbi:hypothetical protein O5D80_002909 [Batrachochytrium dendrobatidis]|nr:hypothetical protein O5D80_002909 [Batrachochytrium dendrobatidis]
MLERERNTLKKEAAKPLQALKQKWPFKLFKDRKNRRNRQSSHSYTDHPVNGLDSNTASDSLDQSMDDDESDENDAECPSDAFSQSRKTQESPSQQPAASSSSNSFVEIRPIQSTIENETKKSPLGASKSRVAFNINTPGRNSPDLNGVTLSHPPEQIVANSYDDTDEQESETSLLLPKSLASTPASSPQRQARLKLLRNKRSYPVASANRHSWSPLAFASTSFGRNSQSSSLTASPLSDTVHSRLQHPDLNGSSPLNHEFLHRRSWAGGDVQPMDTTVGLPGIFGHHRPKWMRLPHQRTGVYDEVGDATNSGMRVWYDDYTTIDWIHDHVKERVRMRGLRSKKSVSGRMAKRMDAVQAWIVLTIIGVASGAVASLVDVSYSWLNDLRYGFCTTGFFYRRNICCSRDAPNCADWKAWPEYFLQFQNLPESTNSYLVAYSMYVALAVVFAGISSMIVMQSATSPVDPDIISRDAQEAVSQPTSTTSITANHSGVSVALNANQLENSSSHSTPVLTQSTARLEYMLDLNEKPVRRVLFHAAGSGVPEVKIILGGFVIRGYLGVRTLVLKTLGIVFSIASGLVVGVQGPLVHISCALGNVFSRLFAKYAKNEGKRRELMSAACAAGVSVAFGAPIGGVLFSLEEVSYYFPLKTMWRSFYCALVAAVTLKLINPLGTGKLVMFQVSYNKEWHPIELIPFLILGIFGGLFGTVFIKATTYLAKFRAATSIPRHPVLEVLIIALATNAISYTMPFTRIGNGELVAFLFSECDSDTKTRNFLCHSDYPAIMLSLFFALVTKLVLMIFTFGIKVPAGLFVPSMVVGACAGRILGVFGLYVQAMYPTSWVFSFCQGREECITPGLYAMVGAAAAISGVTRMTVSLTIIMFELTGGLTYVLPLMVSIMVAKWVGDAFGSESIYDVIIKRSGYPYLNHKRTLVSDPASARDIMVRGGDRLFVGKVYDVEDVETKLAKLEQTYASKDGGLPVVKDNEMLLGYISQTELEHALIMVKNAPQSPQKLVFQNLAIQSFTEQSIDAPTTPVLQQPLDFDMDGSVSQATLAADSANHSDPESGSNATPVDVSQWVDQTPLSVSELSSIELVVELFIKLGVRTLCVVSEGKFVGLIHKKRLLIFLSNKEAQRAAAGNSGQH